MDSGGERPVGYFSLDKLLSFLSHDSEMSYELRPRWVTMISYPFVAIHSNIDGDELLWRRGYGVYEGRGRPSQHVGSALWWRKVLDAREEENGIEEVLVLETTKTLALSTGLLSLGKRSFMVRANPLRQPIVSSTGPSVASSSDALLEMSVLSDKYEVCSGVVCVKNTARENAF